LPASHGAAGPNRPRGAGRGPGSGRSPSSRSPSSRPPEPAGLAARRAALGLVTGVLDDRRPLDQLLDHASTSGPWRALAPQDRALVRALAGATLRRLGQIDDALRRLMERPLPSKALKVKRILQLAAAQILFLDIPDHASVSLAVALVDAEPPLRPWKGLANAVLRNLTRRRDDILAAQDPARFAAPRWLAEGWTAAYGADTVAAFAPYLLREPYLDLQVKADAAGWAERLGAIVLPTGTLRRSLAGAIDELPGFAEGAWWVQDAAAALPARLLGDVAGRRVADLCAAPGGKTAALALAGAHVTALDLSAARLDRLRRNMVRLGLAEVTTVAADLADWTPDAPFDAVLFDAPCSATGTIRRHPDVMRLKSRADVTGLAELQSRLFDRAPLWLKPGGTLVYCTCSLEPTECEAQVERFLAAHPDFSRRPINPAEIGGLAEAVTAAGDLRTLPHHLAPAGHPDLTGLDGFYAARLVRRA
jgi:16S rRNA (cytosine967-C5)-methyltransferase